jgi:hypothetical protein
MTICGSVFTFCQFVDEGNGAENSSTAKPAFIFCPYLGYHSNLQKVLEERVQETIRSLNHVSYVSTYAR